MASGKPRDAFQDVLTAAINDLLEHGFDSQKRLDYWVQQLEVAARASLMPANVLQRTLVDMLTKVYDRTVKDARIIKRHPGISQYTLASIKPKLRAELDRRILASANLIRLNRETSIQRTLQRFSGWATSIPIGGTDIEDRREVKKTVRRGIAGLPFHERLVIHDQGAKLAASIDDIVSRDGGAIAGEWRHVKEGPPAYDARPEHVARDGKIYLIRDSWAHKKAFVKPASNGFTDDITQPAEEIACRCRYVYLYNLRDLPADMLTKKGYNALQEARAAMSRFG
jgi:hypothetical protein